MKPITQSALTILAVLVGISLLFAWRWQNAAGVFNSLPPVSPGVCRVAATLPGAEDFEIDAPHNMIFISSSDRRHPAAADGIYALKLGDPKAKAVRLGGVPSNFHPHGISLYRGSNGGEALMAVNHETSGLQTVEVFSVSYDGDVPKLASQMSIAGGLLVSPNDVFAIGPSQFYVTNDHATRSWLGRFAEDYLLWAHADVLFFGGQSLRIAVERIAFPNGVLVTPDGRHMYVTATNERRLIAFSREDFTGNLAGIGSLALPARPDNITMDAGGNLIIAAHPSLVRVHQFQADLAKPSPSAVFRVHLDKAGVPQSYDTIYANDGQEIGASSSAAVWNGHLFIGSVLDRKFLDCTMK